MNCGASSLVDPDNRHQVDYDRRKDLLGRVRKLGSAPDVSSIQCLLDKPESGALKLYVISKALCLRKQCPDLFDKGGYWPLKIEGAKANHLVAFIRTVEGKSVLVIVPRLVGALLGDSIVPPIGRDIWKDTIVHVPDGPLGEVPGMCSRMKSSMIPSQTEPLPSPNCWGSFLWGFGKSALVNASGCASKPPQIRPRSRR